jgi:hypothetical protein
VTEAAEPRTVAVPFERVAGWISRFDAHHAGSVWRYGPNQVAVASPDGSSASFDVPFPPLADLSVEGLSAHLGRERRLGVVLVRKGGFAVARVVGADVADSKVGKRHVQSRSKAGGWSQQRFARRRENQARDAYDAASGYVSEILLPHASSLDLLVTGGDRPAVDAVFAYRALTPLLGIPRRWLAGIPDPTRAVLDRAVRSARSIDITVLDTTR